MKFLETITFLNNDALVPVDRIKHINYSLSEDGYRITITSDDGSWIECFDQNKEKANKRYEMIKGIIEAS
ncbi:MAG: hypothetical protein ACHQ1D_02915 [Nitrososphaerales archaeon]